MGNTAAAFVLFRAALRAKPNGLDAHQREIKKLRVLAQTAEARAHKFSALQGILIARSRSLFGALWAPHALQEAKELAALYRELADQFGPPDMEREQAFEEWQASLLGGDS